MNKDYEKKNLLEIFINLIIQRIRNIQNCVIYFLNFC